ncbi:MAG: PilZ domain-containing protein, partial [Phycisphaerae bacterium]
AFATLIHRIVGQWLETNRPMPNILPAPAILASLMRGEIERFMASARVRSEVDLNTRKRSHRRYHRSWPLLVSDAQGITEVSAALHDASAMGIGFLCDASLEVGSLVFIKLFWLEDSGLRVPAVVKHISDHRRATLVGCKFAVDDPAACAAAYADRQWYDH